MAHADTPDAAVTVTERMLPALRGERQQLELFDDYMRGKHKRPYKPADATEEYRDLEARSVSNVLPRLIRSISQTLHLEGYRRGDQEDNAQAWSYWQANGLDARQAPLYRASLIYGVSYMIVLPGTTAPVMRPVSPRRMLAVYNDQGADEWPQWALEIVPELDEQGNRRERLRLLDDYAVHELTEDTESPTGGLRHVKTENHDLEVCPVVRYPCEIDLEGRYTGVVGPLIPGQDRLNQSTFDMNVVQGYGSFNIRTAAGMTLPGMPGTPEGGETGDREAARAAKLRVGADRFLVSADHETKFGTLAGTPLDGYIAARDQARRDMATDAEVPEHHLLGGSNASSAEQAAVSDSGLRLCTYGHQQVYGESHEQSLRLAALAAGDRSGWEDHEAQSVWGDTETRSFAQTVDGLVKIREGLEVEPEMLTPMIPGWSEPDVRRAAELRARRRAEDPVAALQADLDRQARPATGSGVPGFDPASRAPAGTS